MPRSDRQLREEMRSAKLLTMDVDVLMMLRGLDEAITVRDETILQLVGEINKLEPLVEQLDARLQQYISTNDEELDPLIDGINELTSEITRMMRTHGPLFTQPDPKEGFIINKGQFRCPGPEGHECGCNVFHKEYIRENGKMILCYVCNGCGEAFADDGKEATPEG